MLTGKASPTLRQGNDGDPHTRPAPFAKNFECTPKTPKKYAPIGRVSWGERTVQRTPQLGRPWKIRGK